jgi:FtsP/CotA-like multicopper oxidase with cupredoxin domain
VFLTYKISVVLSVALLKHTKKRGKIMEKTRFSIFTRLILVLVVLCWCVAQVTAEENAYQKKRHDALDNLQKAIDARHAEDPTFPPPMPQFQPLSTPLSANLTAVLTGPVGFNPLVNYNLPNFAYSPNIRKFVDGLAGLGAPGCKIATPPGSGLGLLPGDTSCNENKLGQYIPVAIPDMTTYPGSDYYELTINQYKQQLHSDLPASGTILRGYAQSNALGYSSLQKVNQYLGPLIIARSYDPSKSAGTGLPWTPQTNGKPVRIKFTNQLPRSNSYLTTPPCAPGIQNTLCLPVDTFTMGAGMGPITGQMYTDNRAAIHLHGGNTPWISDGTPHQWVTPAGDPTVYKKGVSFQNVPDMLTNGTSPCAAAPGHTAACITPDPTGADGIGTLYYTNQQSARLMFYHDHAYGITRLNVYDGMAAGYLLVDQVEDDMITGHNDSGAFTTAQQVLPDLGGIYHYGIPLVIQDKTFVNDTNTNQPGYPGTPTLKTYGTTPPFGVDPGTDPLWLTYVGTTGGNLWMPHEYVPNENIYDPSGALNWGRWDYAPWLNPPLIPKFYTLPSPTQIPESFGDTMVVNGTAFPYIELPPTAVRFRILSVGNDRALNLQVYDAVTSTGTVCNTAYLGGPPPPASACTEVKLVPASSAPALPFCAPGAALNPVTGLPNGCTPTTWPRDGRDGGVPDPSTAGPQWIQIGNEGGLLPQAAVLPQQPIDYEYSRRVPTMLNVTGQTLALMPAERADVILDLSSYQPGDTLIVYNDAPAPFPLFDPRNDLSTGYPDQTAIGGAPSTYAGFGPNTRTVMQIRIVGTPPSFAFDLNKLKTALPQAYKATQAPPIVPQIAYNSAFGTTNGDTYVMNVDATLNLTGHPQSVSTVMTILPGSGYTIPPTVKFVSKDGTGSGAAATAGLNGVTAITVTAAGTGYTTQPNVTIAAPGCVLGTPACVRATAVASITGGGVSAITVVNPGAGYAANPAVAITGGGGTGAAASSGVTIGAVGAITVTNGGLGYMKAPFVFLTAGNGTGAQADAMLNGDTPIGMKNITEGFEPWYGRMWVQLGTTPVPLDPTAPAPQVPGIAQYIDPPSDYWDNGKIYIFRVAHLGVDSHVVHFHLANLQVVNRVDWTNTMMPPNANELGWKESIRTNPFTDLILAVRPQSQVLPFQIPRSVRLLDVTTPLGSTANYVQVAPVPGLPTPAGISNVMTDFGFEYVWHCHLLGHEEGDMMRPIVFNVPLPIRPTNLAAAVSFPTPPPASVNLTWGPAAIDPNTNGFTIQRSTNSTFPAGSTTTFPPVIGNTTKTSPDNTVAVNALYYYRVRAFSSAGNSAWSNTATAITVVSPKNFAATVTQARGSDSVALTWIATGTISSFTIQRATNTTFTAGLTTSTVFGALRSMTQTVNPRTYYYRIRTNTAIGSSAWSPTLTVVAP